MCVCVCTVFAYIVIAGSKCVAAICVESVLLSLGGGPGLSGPLIHTPITARPVYTPGAPQRDEDQGATVTRATVTRAGGRRQRSDELTQPSERCLSGRGAAIRC